MSKCEISDAGFKGVKFLLQVIHHGIEVSPSLKYINLSSCKLTFESCHLLAKILKVYIY